MSDTRLRDIVEVLSEANQSVQVHVVHLADVYQACSTCITNGRSCSYDANVKKRGLPEGYVRGLEKLWGIPIKEVTTVEDSILTALAGSEDNESVLNVWNDESELLDFLLLGFSHLLVHYILISLRP